MTVVVPAYNAAWSIARTIESVLRQTWRDFELLVVNDASTDDLHGVVEPIARRDARIRIIDQPNGGVAAARNRGLAEARGQYVAPLDADDLWHPEYLEAMAMALESDARAPFAYGYLFRIDAIDRLFPMPPISRPPRHDFLGLLSLNSVGCGSAATYRREAMRAVGGYDETLRQRAGTGAEDWKLSLEIAALGQPALVPRALVGYRLVAQSLSQSNPARQLASIEAVLQDIRVAFPKVPSRWFADARTMMIAWLLPAYLGRRMFGDALFQAARAYLLNPRWWYNANLRHVHVYRLKVLVDRLARGARYQPLRLSEAEFEGERPFAFLDDSALRS